MQVLADRIRIARGEMSQAELARRIGVKAQSIQSLEKERAQRSKYVLDIARVLNVNPWWLQYGQGEMNMREDAGAPIVVRNGGIIEVDQDEFAKLPVYDIRVAAGDGAWDDDETVQHHVLFRLQWLRAITSAPVGQLAVMHVAGDSMWETLHHGDMVLIDKAVTHPGRDGIYVLLAGDERQIKRVSMHPETRRITITSDNPRYPTYEGVDPAAVSIIGRVIWLGRQV